MRLLKSIIVGIAAAVGGVVLSVAAHMALLFGLAVLAQRSVPDGSGGIGAVSIPVLFPIGAVVGFVAGFVWQFRRGGAVERSPGAGGA